MVTCDIVCLVLNLILSGFLFWLAGFAEKKRSVKWRLLYLLPFLVTLVLVAIYEFETCMLGVYFGAFLLVFGMLRQEKKVRCILCFVSVMFLVLSLGICLFSPAYRSYEYAEDFKAGFEEMKLHYVLSEQKDIDWDGLYEKYLPLFEEADKAHDEVAASIAWTQFAMEFQDGHVGYGIKDEKIEKMAYEKMYGNDYGLCTMKLSDGKIVAVMVEEDSQARKAGICNGSEITAWNGEPVENLSGTEKVFSFAVEENEEFYEALSIAGMGDETAEVCFIDEAGKEKTVTLSKIGSYHDRMMDCIEDVIDKGVEISNLDWMRIDENTALLRMRFMNYDSEENFSEMETALREEMLTLKEEGVTNLIFDLRSNSGGSGTHVKHILKLIAPSGEHVYAYDAVFDKETQKYKTDGVADDGTVTYQVGQCETYQGEDLWGHGKIIILVNANTVSAGDHFTMAASAYPNVTVMGFTHSNGSCQGVNSVNFDYGMLTYSGALLLNEDGSVFVDTDYSRKAVVPLDVKIPFDLQAVSSLFDEGEDYVLEKAMEEFGK